MSFSRDKAAEDQAPQTRVGLTDGELASPSRRLASGGNMGELEFGSLTGNVRLERLAKDLLWQRAIMAENLDAVSCVDPATNLLLFLYSVGDPGSASSGACCEAARVPRTTALRWMGILERKGLIVSLIDANDRRKTSVTLSVTGRIRVQRCLKLIETRPFGGILL